MLNLQKTCFDSKYTYPPCSENAASSCARDTTPCHSISTLRLSRRKWRKLFCERRWIEYLYLREMETIFANVGEYLRETVNIIERHRIFAEDRKYLRGTVIVASSEYCDCCITVFNIVFNNRDKIKQNNNQNQWQNMNHQLSAVLFSNICSWINRVDISPEIFLACPTLALCAW